jgi:hypothetical protein
LARDGLYITGSGEFVTWQRLVDKLRPINIATENNLCVVSAAKFAIDLAFNVNASPLYDGKACLSVPFLFAEQSKQIDRSGTVINTLPTR